jgi:hypothetical protein
MCKTTQNVEVVKRVLQCKNDHFAHVVVCSSCPVRSAEILVDCNAEVFVQRCSPRCDL